MDVDRIVGGPGCLASGLHRDTRHAPCRGVGKLLQLVCGIVVECAPELRCRLLNHRQSACWSIKASQETNHAVGGRVKRRRPELGKTGLRRWGWGGCQSMCLLLFLLLTLLCAQDRVRYGRLLLCGRHKARQLRLLRLAKHLKTHMCMHALDTELRVYQSSA